MRHDEGLGGCEPDHRMMGEPFEAGEYGRGQRDIIPPGTLGRTYLRVSHPVPLDKHPRTGMLAVKYNGKVPYLTVGIMSGVKMKNGIWLFESTRPLDPGACQLVRVEARETPQDVEPTPPVSCDSSLAALCIWTLQEFGTDSAPIRSNDVDFMSGIASHR